MNGSCTYTGYLQRMCTVIESLSVFNNVNILLPANGSRSGFYVNESATITMCVFTNATGTLRIRWSSDNGVTFSYDETYTIAGGEPQIILLPPKAPYVSYVYTNGAIAQTFFNLIATVPAKIKQSSLFNNTLTPYDNLTFNIAPPSAVYSLNSFVTNPPHLLPENYFSKPIIRTGLLPNNISTWNLRNDYAITLSEPLNVVNAGGATLYGRSVTPPSSMCCVQFTAAIFIESTIASSFIGYGIMRSGNIFSAIGLGRVSTNIPQDSVAIRIFGFSNLTIPLSQWNVNRLGSFRNSLWNNLQTFRFVFIPGCTLLQVERDQIWITCHVMEDINVLIPSGTCGHWIMNINKQAFGTNFSTVVSVTLSQYTTYIGKIINSLLPRSLNISVSVSTTEKGIIQLYSDPLRMGIQTSVIHLKNLVVGNQNVYLILRVYYYPDVEIVPPYVQLNSSYISFAPVNVIYSVGILKRTYIVKNSDTLSLEGLFLYPSDFVLITGQFVSGTANLSIGLNWNE